MFKDWDGRYAAFGSNLVMSVLFVAMLVRRGDVSGQSVHVAFFKMLGTACASLMFHAYLPSSRFLDALCIAIFALDTLYLTILYSRHRRPGIDPWRRPWGHDPSRPDACAAAGVAQSSNLAPGQSGLVPRPVSFAMVAAGTEWGFAGPRGS